MRPTTAEEREPFPGVSILLVDDRPENLLALEAVLEPLGHRLVRARSGEEALASVLEEDFAVILMDIRMPGLDGFETIALLKEREKSSRIPIIFMSAYPAEHHVFQSYAAGAVDYILKPIDPDALRSKVSVFVHLRQHELALQAARAKLERRVAERTAELAEANQALAREIEERKAAEQRLYEHAFYDSVTGLANRSLFTILLNRALARFRRRPESSFAVAILDVDRFKIVNDSLGHLAGDRLLVGFAQRLMGISREIDTVARLGGDEFAILLEGLGDVKDATRFADRIEAALAEPFDIDGKEVFAGASIGIAMMAPRYDGAEDLLRDADAAMYRAKAGGRGRYQVFDVGMHEAALEQLELEGELRRAVERDELCVHFQPIVSLDDDHVTAVEALVRWRHPSRGLLPPAAFLSVAEESGLIRRVGSWVLERACRQLADWRGSGLPDLRMSVNLSASQLVSPTITAEITRVARRWGLDVCDLDLEITETMMMTHGDLARTSLAQLAHRGATLSLDDFGTGYSCLAYLHRFPVSALKIDRGFVARLGARDSQPAIAETIVSLAHNLGMEVVAEGVETADQLEALRAMECERAQGFLFAPPLEAFEAQTFCVQHRRRESA